MALPPPGYEFSPEELQKLTTAPFPFMPRIFPLFTDARIFYCPACDKMVSIKPTPNFRPTPWRTDVFRISGKRDRDVVSDVIAVAWNKLLTITRREPNG